jgi:predicted HNH restriction endonuclease
MPYKDPEVKRVKDAIYKKRHYENNKASHLERSARNKRIRRKEWAAFKASQKCTKCGIQHPALMDFHHVVRDGDKQSVNRLVADGRFKRAMEEVQKCIPLCANCHRLLHWEEDQVKRKKRKKAQSLSKPSVTSRKKT